MSLTDTNVLLASAAIANALLCAISLVRRGPSLAAGSTGLAAFACAWLLVSHWG